MCHIRRHFTFGKGLIAVIGHSSTFLFEELFYGHHIIFGSFFSASNTIHILFQIRRVVAFCIGEKIIERGAGISIIMIGFNDFVLRGFSSVHRVKNYLADISLDTP